MVRGARVGWVVSGTLVCRGVRGTTGGVVRAAGVSSGPRVMSMGGEESVLRGFEGLGAYLLAFGATGRPVW